MNAELKKWLHANLGKRCLAPLTSIDAKALTAAAAIIELYAYDRHATLIDAFYAIVMRMQPTTWHLAYHAIANVLDWNDRAEIWAMAGLPGDDFGKCANEPTSTQRTK